MKEFKVFRHPLYLMNFWIKIIPNQLSKKHIRVSTFQQIADHNQNDITLNSKNYLIQRLF